MLSGQLAIETLSDVLKFDSELVPWSLLFDTEIAVVGVVMFETASHSCCALNLG